MIHISLLIVLYLHLVHAFKLESEFGLQFVATSPYIIKLINTRSPLGLKECTYQIRGVDNEISVQNSSCGLSNLLVKPGDLYFITVSDKKGSFVDTITAFSLMKQPKIYETSYYENEIFFIAWEHPRTVYAYFTTVKVRILSNNSKSVLFYEPSRDSGKDFSLVDGLQKDDICAIEVCHVLDTSFCDVKAIGNCSSCTNKLVFLEFLEKKTIILSSLMRGLDNKFVLNFKLPEHIKPYVLKCYILSSTSLKLKKSNTVKFRNLQNLLSTLGIDWKVVAMLSDYECKKATSFELGDKRFLYGYENSEIIKGTYISAMVGICDQQKCYESRFSDGMYANTETNNLIIVVFVASLLCSIVLLVLLIIYSRNKSSAPMIPNSGSVFFNKNHNRLTKKKIHREGFETFLNSFRVPSEYELADTYMKAANRIRHPSRPTVVLLDERGCTYEYFDDCDNVKNFICSVRYETVEKDKMRAHCSNKEVLGSLEGNITGRVKDYTEYMNENKTESETADVKYSVSVEEENNIESDTAYVNLRRVDDGSNIESEAAYKNCSSVEGVNNIESGNHQGRALKVEDNSVSKVTFDQRFLQPIQGGFNEKTVKNMNSRGVVGDYNKYKNESHLTEGTDFNGKFSSDNEKYGAVDDSFYENEKDGKNQDRRYDESHYINNITSNRLSNSGNGINSNFENSAYSKEIASGSSKKKSEASNLKGEGILSGANLKKKPDENNKREKPSKDDEKNKDSRMEEH